MWQFRHMRRNASASSPVKTPHPSPPAVSHASGLALAPAAATAVLYSPQLLTDPDQMSTLPPALGWLWVLMLLSAAPAVAWVIGRREGSRVPGGGRDVVAGLVQLVVAVILVRLDTWLEVRSGYLLAGSGEEAMSYGLGTSVAGLVGTVTGIAVICAVRLGRGSRSRPTPSVPHPADH